MLTICVAYKVKTYRYLYFVSFTIFIGVKCILVCCLFLCIKEIPLIIWKVYSGGVCGAGHLLETDDKKTCVHLS